MKVYQEIAEDIKAGKKVIVLAPYQYSPFEFSIHFWTVEGFEKGSLSGEKVGVLTARHLVRSPFCVNRESSIQVLKLL